VTRLSLTTANTPGAVAILQLRGERAVRTLEQLTGKTEWQAGVVRLCDFAGIDEGLAVVTTSPTDQKDHAVQLMPHGGLRVVQLLIAYLVENLGCEVGNNPAPLDLYPEAASAIEADMLDTIAKAHSPGAIDLLADQPKRWRAFAAQPPGSRAAQLDRVAAQTRSLNQLIHPPTVVVVGPPNVGKSTLTNALMGKTVSLVADQPGTTRDWVGGLVELDGVAVRWMDTPGLRDSDDAIEQRAIVLARKAIAEAVVLIAMRSPDTPWPEMNALPRVPDLWVMNKADQLEDGGAPGAQSNGLASGLATDHPLLLSAINDQGLSNLQTRVTEVLGLSGIDVGIPWAFSSTLRQWLDNPTQELGGYLGAE